MSIFPKEYNQYDHATTSLNNYVDKYEQDKNWIVTHTIRSDVMRRARSGLRVRKKVFMKRVKKDLSVTRKQVEGILLCLNQRCPYHQMSFDMLDAINQMVSGFNSGTIALLAFGESDKPYETGNREQSVKWKLRNLEEENLLKYEKRKYFKLPIWDLFYQELKELRESGIHIRPIEGEDIL